MKLSYAKLVEIRACVKAIVWFKDNFGEQEYELSELIEIAKAKEIEVNYKDASLLLVNAPELKQMWEEI